MGKNKKKNSSRRDGNSRKRNKKNKKQNSWTSSAYEPDEEEISEVSSRHGKRPDKSSYETRPRRNIHLKESSTEDEDEEFVVPINQDQEATTEVNNLTELTSLEELATLSDPSSVKELILDGRTIQDSDIKYFGVQMSSLKKLSLKGTTISRNVLCKILEGATALESIDLTRCMNLGLGEVKLLSSKNEGLRVLRMDECRIPDEEMINFSTTLATFKNLEVLSLQKMVNLTDDAFRFIQGIGNRLKKLILNGCQSLTDITFQLVAQHCTQLDTLEIRGVERLTDSTLMYMVANKRYPLWLTLGDNAFSDEGQSVYLDKAKSELFNLRIRGAKIKRYSLQVLASYAEDILDLTEEAEQDLKLLKSTRQKEPEQDQKGQKSTRQKEPEQDQKGQKSTRQKEPEQDQKGQKSTRQKKAKEWLDGATWSTKRKRTENRRSRRCSDADATLVHT